jgi:hypothetical protein
MMPWGLFMTRLASQPATRPMINQRMMPMR